MWQCSDATWWSTLEPMQVEPPHVQMLNQCKLCHLLAKFTTNARGAMLLLNLIQVTESISGSLVPLAMFEESTIIDDLSKFCKAYLWECRAPEGPWTSSAFIIHALQKIAILPVDCGRALYTHRSMMHFRERRAFI